MKNLSLFLMLLAFSFGFSQPTTNAPTPTKAAADVISIFSDAYTNVATNYSPYWGQNPPVTVNPNFVAVSGSGNNILAYTNFNYQGTELTTQNAASMEYLHIDVWTNTAGAVLKVSPINNGTGASEFLVNVPLTNAGWSSVDLPKSAFTGMTWNSVFQIKFDGQSGTNPSNIYLDNIYFWKNPVNPAADATLSDLKVNGTTVSGFSSAILSYTLEYPQGTTAVPQITAATTTNASATKVITQSSAIPGTATVLVTSQNGLVTKTYMVNYVVSGPNVAAPTPPARAATDVISMFSNAYANIPIDAWSAVWDDSSISDIQVAGNDTKKIIFTNFLGVDFSGAGHHINATNFTHFHMDIWIDNSVDLVGKVFNLKLSQWGGTSGEVSALELPLNTGTTPALVKGQWLSIDVPLSSWTNNAARNDIAQFVITSNIGTVYFDNLYFHKATVLGTNEAAVSKSLRVYPNPANVGETITAESKVKTIEVYTLSGQKVKSENSNTISTQGFAKGMYILKTTTDKGEVQSSKVIVK